MESVKHENCELSYETVIGLEVHAELNTRTKMFCSCPNLFGAKPNTLCCNVCAGLPGGIPVMNRRAVEKSVMAGLALHCEIVEFCRMDRKQYFYPDYHAYQENFDEKLFATFERLYSDGREFAFFEELTQK